MNLTKRNDNRMLRRGDLFSLMDDFFNDSVFRNYPREFESLKKNFMPTVEVKETKNAYLVDVEIPGMKKEEIELNFENNTLYLRGEKKEETEKKEGERVYYSEKYYGSFSRQIPFTEEVDAQKIDAKYENGVLKINLEKKITDTPVSKTINIR